MLKLFRNGRILQPDFSLKLANILIQDDIIYDILEPEETPRKPVDTEIDLKEQIVFPGLINAHDHLVDTCWEGLGECPVENWYDWDSAVRSSDDYKSMQKLSVTDLYILGMYKNILSGATTVVDHFPSEVSKTFSNHPLTSILEHLNLAHSVSTRQLHWGRNIGEEFKNSRGIIPFILHIGQGTAQEIKEELETLNRLGALDSNTVLVDCCHLTMSDLQLVSAKKASIVWLPSSTARMFGKQPDIETILNLNIPLAIGTDSSISGSKGLLNELNTALKYSEENLNGKITPKDLVRMATIDAAKIFGLEKMVGSIQPGKSADMIIFRAEEGKDPFKAFIDLKPEMFSMVIHRGAMIVGNDEFRKFSSIDFSLYSEVRINGTSKILYGRPVQLLDRINHKLGKTVNFKFFPIQPED